MRRSIAFVILLALVPFEVGAKPCACPDLADLRAALKEVKRTRTVWYSILADLVSHSSTAPKSPADAAKMFADRAGFKTVRQVGGLDLNEVKIDPQFAAEHCDGVVEGVRAHENDHFWWMFWRWPFGLMSSQRGVTTMLVRTEISARNAEAKFLAQQIADLKKKCGREYSVAEPGSSPGSGRIQDVTE